MKKILFLIIILLVLLITILLINTISDQPEKITVDPIVPLEIGDDAIERLVQAIKIPTISYDDPLLMDTTAFKALHNFMESAFPLVHSKLQREVIHGYSLLYKWSGKNKELPPVILMGHMDMVPVEEASLHLWEVDPFGGIIKDGFIWGRGTLDDKNGVLGILEAVEILLKEGHMPEADIYLAFGHDEEAGGNGAIATTELLKSRNIRAGLILDEGGIVADGIVPGVNELVSLIGTAEKGQTSIELSVNLEGGHSSMPSKETAIELLSRAVVRLRENPFPARITAPVEGLLNTIKPYMSFFQRMVLSNIWLFKPAIINNYEQSPSGNATIRTTTAPTIFRSGIKENLLPAEATAILNFRILPGETTDDVIEHVKKVIEDDRIIVKKVGSAQEPSFISSSNNIEFNTIKISLKQIFGDIIVSPYLVVGATDARHYKDISDNIYRFSPMILVSEDLKRIHGLNERISVENYKNGIRFYYQLIKNIDVNYLNE
ncbi:MAG: M20 family peptidase [Bacteroidota bacterium]|nr:M20 family peptidase [Bacteroidota bacterium]